MYVERGSGAVFKTLSITLDWTRIISSGLDKAWIFEIPYNFDELNNDLKSYQISILSWINETKLDALMVVF